MQAYPQVLEEYAPTGTVQVSYVYGNDLISQTQGGQTTYYHVDGLGSTTELTNTVGTVVSSSRYDAYGNAINSTGSVSNKYGFTGEQFDQYLGDYYLRQRYYDTQVGRFTRSDSYEGEQWKPLTLHKYIYTHADPVNGIDPSGLATTDLGKAAEALIRTEFKLNNYKERDFDLQIAAKNRNASTIWKRLGIDYSAVPFSVVSNRERRGKPDLIDYGNKQLYEIKTERDFDKGRKELDQYLATMNKVNATWDSGSIYIPAPILPVPGYGTVRVRGPRQGVITYEESNFNRLIEVETTIKILTLLIAEYISLLSATRGLAV